MGDDLEQKLMEFAEYAGVQFEMAQETWETLIKWFGVSGGKGEPLRWGPDALLAAPVYLSGMAYGTIDILDGKGEFVERISILGQTQGNRGAPEANEGAGPTDRMSDAT